ncbi:dynamin family protein [Piscibacillus sp. B03]|uniref:dynamin family protein n=1 Tax=Piscibacillus sp. B03 TaxID=3457430 RepID=UPI003FCD22E7
MITKELTSESYHFDVLWEKFNKKPYQNLEDKLLKLYKKWQSEQLTVGFTGHFSAGKSTLINALLENDILPSSPIPTSANIVEVQYSEEEATIYNLPGKRQATESEVNLNHVKQLARNGEEVQTITIQKPIELLKNNITLMDTPGIDSSDDEEFKRTLSNTYLIDYFVYVMDYNHVQSEVNFKFLKELEDNDIPFIMVVNQVDKHNEKELQFDSFKQSLKNSCRSWGIKPKEIFYTSLLDREHPLNQFNELQTYIKQLIENKDTLIQDKLTFELSNLIQKWVSHELRLEDFDIDLVNEKRNSIKRLFEEKEIIQQDLEQFRAKLNQAMNELFQNAYIMSFDTRELAKSYLESLQPKFKVGKLFAKKKTEEERQSRLNAFLNDVQDRVKTEMVWHIRHLLMNMLSDKQVENAELVEKIQNFDVDVTEEVLNKSVNPSAEVNANSVLVYTDQLHKDLSQFVKQEATPIMNELVQVITHQQQKRIDMIDEQIEDYEKELDEFNDVHEMEEKHAHLTQMLKEQVFVKTDTNEQISQAVLRNEDIRLIDINDLIDEELETEATDLQEITHEQASFIDVEKLKEKGSRIRNQLKELKPLKPFERTLTNQLDQLENTELTIALFGAFSAGKSSFANAWLGESVLPASPNPTTAAINKIAPISEEHPHGEVRVKFKTADELLHQLFMIVEPYTSQTFKDLTDLVKFLYKNQKLLNQQLNKTESSFINAFLDGYEQSRVNLGKQISITINDFSKYVTVESISCFVKEMTIYFDCELTRKGITLVDTPGADSIHSRHTNTSFHYVKNSDAIIYVNYYNHAFSRADREFLIQLGRVKDTFALDKMFFILNAADLAKDENELTLVKDYLKNQLMQYGISNPSIYPLSSKALLDGKESMDEQPFFNRFNQFIDLEAKEIMANQLDLELKRLERYLSSTVEEASSNSEKQEEQLNQFIQQITHVIDWANNHTNSTYVNEVTQEIDELTHYLHQRLMIQLNDLMKESINPVTINSNGKQGKEQLKIALKKLQVFISEQWAKEFETTHLILDRELTVVLEQWAKQFNQFIEENTQLTKLLIKENSFSNMKQPGISVLLTEPQLSELMSMYKNKKEFFEQQKVKDLFEKIKMYMDTSLKTNIDTLNQELKAHYTEQFRKTKESIVQDYKEQQQELVENKRLIYHNEDYINTFKELLNEIQ